MTFRRRTYLINASFQMKVIIIFVLISVAGSLAAMGAFHYFAHETLESLRWSTHISARSTGELFKPLFIKVSLAGFIFISLALTVTAFIILRRAAGRIQSMSQDIEKVAGGDLNRTISVEDAGDFRETAQELNSMLFSLRTRFTTIHEKYGAISHLLAEITQDAGGEQYDAVLKEIDVLNEELGKFNVPQ